jgi:hypothetical protein
MGQAYAEQCDKPPILIPENPVWTFNEVGSAKTYDDLGMVAPGRKVQFTVSEPWSSSMPSNGIVTMTGFPTGRIQTISDGASTTLSGLLRPDGKDKRVDIDFSLSLDHPYWGGCRVNMLKSINTQGLAPRISQTAWFWGVAIGRRGQDCVKVRKTRARITAGSVTATSSDPCRAAPRINNRRVSDHIRARVLRPGMRGRRGYFALVFEMARIPRRTFRESVPVKAQAGRSIKRYHVNLVSRFRPAVRYWEGSDSFFNYCWRNIFDVDIWQEGGRLYCERPAQHTRKLSLKLDR